MENKIKTIKKETFNNKPKIKTEENKLENIKAIQRQISLFWGLITIKF